MIPCIFATLWMVCSITGADVGIQDGFADSLRDSKLQDVKGEKIAQDFKFFVFFFFFFFFFLIKQNSISYRDN